MRNGGALRVKYHMLTWQPDSSPVAHQDRQVSFYLKQRSFLSSHHQKESSLQTNVYPSFSVTGRLTWRENSVASSLEASGHFKKYIHGVRHMWLTAVAQMLWGQPHYSTWKDHSFCPNVPSSFCLKQLIVSKQDLRWGNPCKMRTLALMSTPNSH